ncbi:MAG: hypothetical protein MUE60_02125 [Candidatus Eisenbacteria bacterium]|jgi:hypothetical protein|nr:hypothetical protein [Candidatus Eisenbacteria bacterium]
MHRLWVVLALGSLASAHAEWQSPVNIGSVINTDSNDWYPVLNRGGTWMVFVSDRPDGYGSSDLWISVKEGGEWQPPRNLGPQVNTAYCESAPYLAPGDSVLYFASLAPGGQGAMDIYRCTLTEGVAGTKENFGPPANSGALDCCPVVDAEGSTIYFCSTHTGGFGSMDAWVSRRSELGWSEPENLGAAVNSSATDCPRWLSDDGGTLLICSTRSDGHGDADMWIAQRQGDAWGPMVNMGAVLNTSAAEWGASFLDNNGVVGGTIFFGSGRTGGSGGWDIWYAEEATDAQGLMPMPGIGLSLFPNPTRTGTTVSYVLHEAARVVIAIYDMQGRLTRLLMDQHRGPGCYCTRWDGTSDMGGSVSGGGYCCTVMTGDCTRSEPLLVSR